MADIAIVTPVKNEIKNLPRFFDALEQSDIRINTLIIIENDSDDGSRQYLEGISELNNVENFYLIEKRFENKEYSIGFKYSEIINHGFNFLKDLDQFDRIGFIGILDSDCFIQPGYFTRLLQSFSLDDKLGITSGIIKYDNGQFEKINKGHVRGSGRLWSKKCFLEMGSYYGLSPDSISAIKAELQGYHVKLTKSAYLYSRPVNSRDDKSFRGRSAYYNGIPLSYVILKSMKYVFTDFSMSRGMVKGYFEQMKTGVKNPDKSIRQFNSNRLINKIAKLYR